VVVAGGHDGANVLGSVEVLSSDEMQWKAGEKATSFPLLHV
jgi:hypothetical protein